MYSLLVLGLVPGTNIQISFQVWLGLLAALIAAVIIIRRQLDHLREYAKLALANLPRELKRPRPQAR